MDTDLDFKKWWMASIISLILVLTPSSIFIEEIIIKPELHDGSIVELGRYTFVYDAIEHIEEQDTSSVISIGSSKIREAFNGEEIKKNSATRGVDFYNLGLAADLPYFRSIQIEPILDIKPELLIIEIGPNSFSQLKSPLRIQDFDRMNALLYNRPINSGDFYHNILDPNDISNLNLNWNERLISRTDASFEAFELTIGELVGEDEGWNCDNEISNIRCVPPPESSHFHTYLQYPPQFSNAIEYYRSLDDGSLEEFYGTRLDNYLSTPNHQPEGIYNKNHRSLDFIINLTIDSGTDVLLLGLPYNPILKERLEPNAWQYYNESIETYSLREEITVLDLMWDPLLSSEEYFNDYTHFSRNGERQLTRIISPVIDDILAQREVSLLPNFEYLETWSLENTFEPIISGNVSKLSPSFLNLSQPTNIFSGRSDWSGSTWELETNELMKTIFRSSPNNDISSNEIFDSPQIDYCFNVNETYDYYLWLEMNPPDGRSDSIYVGLDGELLPFGRRGIQSFEADGGIRWRDGGDNGERLIVTLTQGIHCLNFWVREDGIEIHSVLFVVDEEFSPVG